MHERGFTANSPETEIECSEWFRLRSLELLKRQVVEAAYPGYPAARLGLTSGAERTGLFNRWHLPDGPWHMAPAAEDAISEEQSAQFMQQGYRLDSQGRPVHPWIDDMLADPDIGVVTGKGFYWKWGPNRTADPVIIRHDLDTPHVLLIQRRDMGRWALPGGFVDDGENPVDAAMREAHEEAGIDLATLSSAITHVYTGPLADLRVTANAWPETTAIRFDLTADAAAATDGMIQAGDDAVNVCWAPTSQLTTQLFGSHLLLIHLSQQI